MQIWRPCDKKWCHYQKQWNNANVWETSQIIYHSKGLDESYPKMQVLSNLSNFAKSYGHLSEILAFYHISTYQIWLNHMTPSANFGNLQLSPYMALNFRKNITTFRLCTFITSKVIGKKPRAWWKTPPSQSLIHVALRQLLWKKYMFYYTLFWYFIWIPDMTL